MNLFLVHSEVTNLGPMEIYRSADGRYLVTKFIGYTKDPTHQKMAWLIIVPQGNTPLHDWRDMQSIKNEICGPDKWAVEIYPSEDCHIDAKNNFHLWVWLDGQQPPFGFKQGRVIVDPRLNHGEAASPQRSFSKSPEGAVDSVMANKLLINGIPALLSPDEYAKMK